MDLPEGSVIIDRRTGDLPGQSGAVEMDGEGLQLLDGAGTVCAHRFTLSLLLLALLDDEGEELVYKQRLAKTGAARAALTWRSGVGTPISGVGLPKIVSAAVTEPFDPKDRLYGVALRWQGDVFLPIGETG